MAEFIAPANPLTRLPEDAVTLELFIVNPRSGERSLITASERDSNLVEAIFDPVKNPSGVPIQLRLVHTSRVLQPLFCAVYALEDDFDKSIQALFPSGVWLQPGSDAWTDAANPDLIFNLGMRPEPVDHGTGSTHTALKLVVATGEFDPTLLVQAGMEAPVTKTAINQAVQRSLPPTPEGQEDWYTHTVWLEISVTEELAGESQPADVSHEAQAGSPEDDFLYFNGINGETGDYDLPPVSLIDLSEMIQGAQPPGNLDEPRRQEQDE